jgi:hypothetical protein
MAQFSSLDFTPDSLKARGCEAMKKLIVKIPCFNTFDAYYFPEESIPISRLSEPKNFSSSSEPRSRTVLCAELPQILDVRSGR